MNYTEYTGKIKNPQEQKLNFSNYPGITEEQKNYYKELLKFYNKKYFMSNPNDWKELAITHATQDFNKYWKTTKKETKTTESNKAAQKGENMDFSSEYIPGPKLTEKEKKLQSQFTSGVSKAMNDKSKYFAPMVLGPALLAAPEIVPFVFKHGIKQPIKYMFTNPLEFLGGVAGSELVAATTNNLNISQPAKTAINFGVSALGSSLLGKGMRVLLNKGLTKAGRDLFIRAGRMPKRPELTEKLNQYLKNAFGNTADRNIFSTSVNATKDLAVGSALGYGVGKSEEKLLDGQSLGMRLAPNDPLAANAIDFIALPTFMGGIQHTTHAIPTIIANRSNQLSNGVTSMPEGIANTILTLPNALSLKPRTYTVQPKHRITVSNSEINTAYSNVLTHNYGNYSSSTKIPKNVLDVLTIKISAEINNKIAKQFPKDQKSHIKIDQKIVNEFMPKIIHKICETNGITEVELGRMPKSEILKMAKKEIAEFNKDMNYYLKANYVGFADQVWQQAAEGTAYEQLYTQNKNAYDHVWRLHPYHTNPKEGLMLYEDVRGDRYIARGQKLANGTLEGVGYFSNDASVSLKDDPFILLAKQASNSNPGYSSRWGTNAARLVIKTSNSEKLPSAKEMMESWKMLVGGKEVPLDFNRMQFIHSANDWNVGLAKNQSNPDKPKINVFNAHGEDLTYIVSPEGKRYAVEVDFGGVGSSAGGNAIKKVVEGVNHAGENPIITVHISEVVKDPKTKRYKVKTPFRSLPNNNQAFKELSQKQKLSYMYYLFSRSTPFLHWLTRDKGGINAMNQLTYNIRQFQYGSGNPVYRDNPGKPSQAKLDRDFNYSLNQALQKERMNYMLNGFKQRGQKGEQAVFPKIGSDEEVRKLRTERQEQNKPGVTRFYTGQELENIMRTPMYDSRPPFTSIMTK